MSSTEKLAYVRRLWAEALNASATAELTATQQQELERRLDAHRKDPSAAIPWEQVRAELSAKYGPGEDS